MDKRFYLADFPDRTSIIDGAEFHHLAHVMRIQAGDEIELIDGQGSLARARIEKMEKNSAAFSVIRCEKHSKPQPQITIAIPFLRMEKLDWTIEKATELGVDSIILFPARLCEKGEISDHQIDRLRHLSIAAMKQCKRLYLPLITILPSLEKVLELSADILYGDVDPNAPSLAALSYRSPVLLITGPEKGFSPSEEKLLKYRARGVRLHLNILRAETAPIAALALLSKDLKLSK